MEEGQKSAIVYDTRDVFMTISTAITRIGESIQGKADFTWQQNLKKKKVLDSDAVDKCNQEGKKITH